MFAAPQKSLVSELPSISMNLAKTLINMKKMLQTNNDKEEKVKLNKHHNSSQQFSHKLGQNAKFRNVVFLSPSSNELG